MDLGNGYKGFKLSISFSWPNDSCVYLSCRTSNNAFPLGSLSFTVILSIRSPGHHLYHKVVVNEDGDVSSFGSSGVHLLPNA